MVAENNGQHAFLTVGDFNRDGISDVAAVTNAAQAPYQLTSTTGLGSMLKLYDGTAMTKDGFKYSRSEDVAPSCRGIASRIVCVGFTDAKRPGDIWSLRQVETA